MDAPTLSWLGTKGTLCQYGKGQTVPQVLCEDSSVGNSQYSLSMTLTNVMPHDEGKYLCKLRSNLGVGDTSTFLTVEGGLFMYIASSICLHTILYMLFFYCLLWLIMITDCLDSLGHDTNESHAMCWFSGFYPDGTIHWFEGGVNLTDSAETQDVEEKNGRYKVSSVLRVEKENSSLLYNCSLWIPSARRYVSMRQFSMAWIVKSSGRMVRVEWMYVTVGIMMVISMTLRGQN